ncbi:MAG: hypothetical protein OXN83_00735 [Oligoflexia bacterium]|nr:hypothetical protein [Oligoflexia bacterium]
MDVQTNLATTLIGSLVAGVGLGIMSLKTTENALLFGFPISIAGLIPLFWTREYVPIHEQEFQCVKISDE